MWMHNLTNDLAKRAVKQGKQLSKKLKPSSQKISTWTHY